MIRSWPLLVGPFLVATGVLTLCFARPLRDVAVHAFGGGFGVYPTPSGGTKTFIAQGPFIWMSLIWAVAGLLIVAGVTLLLWKSRDAMRALHNWRQERRMRSSEGWD